jgi:hypothetical protein
MTPPRAGRVDFFNDEFFTFHFVPSSLVCHQVAGCSEQQAMQAKQKCFGLPMLTGHLFLSWS